MGGIIERIKAWWTQSSSTQRATTIGGVVITLLLMVGVFSYASKPRFTLLYGGLSQEDQAAIVTEIQAQGIPVKYDVPGQIEVPEGEASKLRMSLVTSGKVPKSAHMGNEALNTSGGVFDTPAKERERLRAIAEGELAKSIETNPGVRSARVHITLGDPSPFSEQQRPATASVSLITTGSGSISREAARGIAMLVANSVEGLEMKRVVVLDERGQALYNGGDLEGADALASNKLELEQSISRREELRLQALLDGIYGVGATRVSVRCEVDMDQRHVKKNERVVGKGAETKVMSENMKGAGGGTPGAGLGAQTPAAVTGGAGDDYKSEVKQLEPNITETVTENERAVGTIKSLVINVAANNKEELFGDPEKLQSLTALVETEVAGKEGDSGFIAKVTPVAFDESGKTQMVQAQTEAASAAKMQQILSVLPIAALLVVGVLVVKQIGKMGQPTTTSIVMDNGQVLQVPLVNGQIPSNAILASMQDPAMQPRLAEDADNSESLQRSLAKFTEEELAQMTEDGIIYRSNEDVLEVEKIKEKKSAHLVAIKQMAKDRPEPTAMLIKTWLSEPTR
ncbi:MAG TPA: flagellar M-ring protein FliF C-terminal domain-containing protein [Fimbriimonas sp.]|nr:flagellar M-ring protein FliF C-terminal domain-containing protein [Fimbriimonas sp.]